MASEVTPDANPVDIAAARPHRPEGLCVVPRGGPMAATSSVKRLRNIGRGVRPKSAACIQRASLPGHANPPLSPPKRPDDRRARPRGVAPPASPLFRFAIAGAPEPDSSLGLVPLQDLPANTAGSPDFSAALSRIRFSGADASTNTLPDCVYPGRQSHTPKRMLSSWGF
jgi:hypothetical protein